MRREPISDGLVGSRPALTGLSLVIKSQCVYVPQTGNVHAFTYDSSGRRGETQYVAVRRPDVLVPASHHVLESGETIVIPGTLTSTPLSSTTITSHHNMEDGQVSTDCREIDISHRILGSLSAGFFGEKIMKFPGRMRTHIWCHTLRRGSSIQKS